MLLPNRRFSFLLATLLFLAIPVSGMCAGKPALLFDREHGERFVAADKGDLQLSSLAGLFRSAGFDVRETVAAFSDSSLAEVDAVVISGPFTTVPAAETEALARFVARGGRLAVMLHIAPPAIPLLERLGVAVSNGVIHERGNVIDGNDLNFRLLSLERHPLMTGLADFAARGVWAVTNFDQNSQVIASTTMRAWIDLNRDGALSKGDAVQAFGVAVAGTMGKGRFVVFGDDAIFQNRFLTGGNEALARNLAEWMKPE
jgi:hypothetical protein